MFAKLPRNVFATFSNATPGLIVCFHSDLYIFPTLSPLSGFYIFATNLILLYLQTLISRGGRHNGRISCPDRYRKGKRSYCGTGKKMTNALFESLIGWMLSDFTGGGASRNEKKSLVFRVETLRDI